MRAKVTILGCGNSTGVPAIGNYWGDCDPDEPKNNRLRSSVAIQSDKTTLIIDTGPDLRQQINRENISNVDAILYSHAHGDHLHGIDDLRFISYKNKKLIPIYGNRSTVEEIKSRFSYLFEGGNHELYPPVIKPLVIEEGGYGTEHIIEDISFIPYEQDHGSCKSLGYRFGNFAYSVDLWRLDDVAVNTLKGINIWVVDCAGYNHNNNPVHASLQTLFDLNQRIKAKKVYLTSMTLLMDYRKLCNELPQGFAPAYDGFKLEINLPA